MERPVSEMERNSNAGAVKDLLENIARFVRRASIKDNLLCTNVKRISTCECLLIWNYVKRQNPISDSVYKFSLNFHSRTT